jgi:hypothetical protein
MAAADDDDHTARSDDGPPAPLGQLAASALSIHPRSTSSQGKGQRAQQQWWCFHCQVGFSNSASSIPIDGALAFPGSFDAADLSCASCPPCPRCLSSVHVRGSGGAGRRRRSSSRRGPRQLVKAAAVGDCAELARLLARGINVDAVDDAATDSDTAFCTACEGGHPACVTPRPRSNWR